MVFGGVYGELALIDVGIQLVVAIPSIYFQTELFYDITGSITFVILSRLSLQYSQQAFHNTVQSGMVTAWAARLGCYLFYRALQTGHDRRFNKIRINPQKFLIAWTIQAIWIYACMLPTLINNKNRRTGKLTTIDFIGWGLWTIGMIIEVVADYQKQRFRVDPDNAGKFISTGLWSLCRHPNYFGEILLWFGLFLSASSSFQGLQWLSVLCPIFIYILLVHVSGIPFLEKPGMKRWGHLPEYQNYIKTVPLLIPFLGSP